jgi:asparagine synthase (glutamine-hydrolysing)
MCGIAGLLTPRTSERDALLRSMARAIIHRGPDSEGFHEDAQVGLTMRRLAIIDVHDGEQPVYNESRQVVAIFNGEIYNYRELQAVLEAKGHVLGSRSDSDCIPHLYEEYGLEFVQHLRGMFAVALWDANRNRLVLARDRFGKKPLYYRHDAHGMAFASELKALLADPATDRAPDPVALSHYLTYQYVPAPFSALRSVRKVEPASLLVLENGTCRTFRYWSLDYRPADSPAPTHLPALAEELRERLLEAVGARLVSERPLGAFLSGGVDSSAVVAAMSRVSTEQVKTFSIGFDEESFNELPYARQVADLYGTDHHEMIVRPDVEEILPRIARSFDEPFADSSAIPSYYLAQMAHEHVVVALNGDGGDEVFGGYLRYPLFLKTPARDFPPAIARLLYGSGRLLRPFASRSAITRRLIQASVLLAEPTAARRYARILSYFRPEEKRSLLSSDFAADIAGRDSYDLVDRVWDAHADTDEVNRLLAVDTYTYLPGDLLPKVDITTMASSLEARSPFLDHRLAEWAAALPGEFKVRGGTTKWLLKEALDPWLPHELIHRRKMGFGIPLAAWLRGPLRELAYDTLTDSTASSRGWFRTGAVQALLVDHMAGSDRSPQIYALLMLELWMREVVESVKTRVS